MADVFVAKVSEIPQGGKKIVEINGIPIAVFNLANKFYAIENICPHQAGSLGDGELIDGNVIVCPRHAWTFNVKTGINTKFDSIKVNSFPTIVENGDVKIVIEN